MDEQLPGQHPDHQHGYTSGIEGLDRQAYEAYLSSQVSYEWATEQLIEKKAALHALENEQQEVIARRKTTFDSLQEHLLGLNQTARRVEELEGHIEQTDQETATLKEKRAAASTHYSLLAGFIFLLAGLAFIFGDLIISHEIVAYALNIRNSNEAWAFAVGLAMVSILLKPAYDRLIEGPYQTDDSPRIKKRYGRFKVALALFAIATLLVLGWFRYEAYRTDKLKEAINKSIKNLQLNAVDPLTGAPINSPELTNKIEQALRDSDNLNMMLVNSPWALLSFVLSGVLFAIAGAVSLGMALPVLQSFWFRWLQIDPRLGRLRRRRKKLMKALVLEEKVLSQQLIQKNIKENDLSVLPVLDTLSEKEKALLKEIENLEEERKLALTDTRIHAYNDGHARGEVARNIMNEEEYEQWRNSHLTVSNLALRAKSSVTDRAVSRSRSSGMRPHQAIRKAITDRFDEENR
ncbi:hypothetical protein [Arundinibacter roseus]|uniref:DUF4407 domain-containing protein n=1 Tax=Arundinibacter roseus TaxID=2070510 RepID=A0A4R4K046_9BACT|nr:hypothetical protein [Arundinibacter roseus]TDB59812.1 hypothetical protein EZE20_21900 [Arundinibacter roseus]